MSDSRYQPLEVTRPGVPYRARDLATAQTVLIHTMGGLAAAAAAGVLMRADRVKGLVHPALVSVFEVSIDSPGSLQVVGEFVPAQTLQRAMGGLSISAKRALEIVADVAAGVAVLHAHQFTHGAISLESVLQTDKGRTKLDVLRALTVGNATEEDDLKALAGLLRALGCQPPFDIGGSGSAAVVAAHLRAAAKAP